LAVDRQRYAWDRSSCGGVDPLLAAIGLSKQIFCSRGGRPLWPQWTILASTKLEERRAREIWRFSLTVVLAAVAVAAALIAALGGWLKAPFFPA